MVKYEKQSYFIVKLREKQKSRSELSTPGRAKINSGTGERGKKKEGEERRDNLEDTDCAGGDRNELSRQF